MSALVSQITSSGTNYGIASKANQTVIFSVIPIQKFTPFKTVKLNATSSSRLTPITYTIANPALGVISNDILLLEGTGSTTITASQPGNQYYNPASAIQTLIVK